MKYEKYKNLTEQQKEEYNFRFKDEVTYSTNSMLWSVIILIASLSNYLFIVYLSITDKALEQYKGNIMSIFAQSIVLVAIIGWTILAFCISYLIRVSYRFYQYRKWLKENNIK